eukprot:TRINITY_DN9755_c0_g1_i1.p1 TRINITY_DN9755_c0_g1~~TRINITY_DN9755_c0_g1_i1.p1  ORF type:complete len:162 (+),score=7.82 TRINITY_DN9755_c0_g1_i1:103-588(+)
MSADPVLGVHTSRWGPTLEWDLGDQKISPGPSSQQKISPIPIPYHPHPGPTNLTVYNPFRWVCSRSNGPVYSNGCAVNPTVQFIRMGVKPRGREKFVCECVDGGLMVSYVRVCVGGWVAASWFPRLDCLWVLWVRVSGTHRAGWSFFISYISITDVRSFWI